LGGENLPYIFNRLCPKLSYCKVQNSNGLDLIISDKFFGWLYSLPDQGLKS